MFLQFYLRWWNIGLEIKVKNCLVTASCCICSFSLFCLSKSFWQGVRMSWWPELLVEWWGKKTTCETSTQICWSRDRSWGLWYRSWGWPGRDWKSASHLFSLQKQKFSRTTNHPEPQILQKQMLELALWPEMLWWPEISNWLGIRF